MIDEEITAALRPLVQGHVINAQDLLVHPQRRPQGDWAKDLPAIVYNRVSESHEEYDDLCGSELSRLRTQVDCYAQTYKQARQLAYQANRVLVDMGLPDEPHRGGRLISMQSFVDDAEKAYRWTVEHYFWCSLAEAEAELGIS